MAFIRRRRRRYFEEESDGVIWQKTLDSEWHLGAVYTWRNVIPAADISGDAAKIKVTFNAPPSGGQREQNASIVERDGSGPNGTEVPTELLFSGGSGFSLSAGESIVSDELNFAIDSNKDYLVIMDLINSGAPDWESSWIYRGYGETCYYKQGRYSALVKDMPAGYSTADAVIMSKIEAVSTQRRITQDDDYRITQDGDYRIWY